MVLECNMSKMLTPRRGEGLKHLLEAPGVAAAAAEGIDAIEARHCFLEDPSVDE